MNELVKTLAEPHLMHERWNKYGDGDFAKYRIRKHFGIVNE